ncbi:MAG: cation transporter [Treponema sp.]|nr:cation transporter [Treponema sp.]
MTVIGAGIFIKNHKNYSDPKVRRAYGILCSSVGIFLNILTFGGKFIAGKLSGSVSLTADAFNNLSDAASSIISLLGFKLSGKKPDKDHPFGHGRMEYIAGLAVSFLIFMMGFELIKGSVANVIEVLKNRPELSALTDSFGNSLLQGIVLGCSILIKFYMYLYNHFTAKKINSPAMEAVAKDSLSDMISTSVVIAALLISRFTTLPVDGIGGIIVALFIFKTGFEAAKETIDPLLGLPPETDFVKEVEKEVLSFKPIIGIHDLIVHDYGPGRLFMSLHAEVPGDQNIFELHEVIDDAEFAVSEKFNCLVTIHMDPVDLKNERLVILKQFAVAEAKKIHKGISIHDVRMVPGEKHTNLIFDAVRPHDCTLSKEEIKQILSKRINETEQDINCVITIDDPFV